MAHDGSLRILVAGATHRSAPLEVRERMAEEGGPLDDLVAAAGLTQALVLATCDRVEIVGAAAEPEAVAARLVAGLALRGGIDVDRGYLRWLADEGAIRHLFAIAAGLESLVLGEPEVLGQVHEAEREARRLGRFGPELDGLMQVTYRTAKRVRSETTIGAGPVSLAASAVAVARDVHGVLARSAGLLIGAADIGELIAGQLKGAGLGRLAVCHWRERQAVATAQRLGAAILPFDGLESGLGAFDIVVAGAGRGRWILGRSMLERALRARRRRPVFVIDTSLPPDVEPGVDDLDGIFRYDLADLERVARTGRGEREAAAAAAWAIVDAGVADVVRDRAMREAVGAIRLLRQGFEAERTRLLAERGELDAAEATRLLLNRLLHGPSEAIRAAAAAGADAAELEAWLLRLFPWIGDGKKGS